MDKEGKDAIIIYHERAIKVLSEAINMVEEEP